MKKLDSSDIEFNGLKQLTFLDEFTYIHHPNTRNYYKEIEELGFKSTSSRCVGPDLMIGETQYRRLTQYEKDYNNLEYQIKQLENRFKIKITYKQNEH